MELNMLKKCFDGLTPYVLNENILLGDIMDS